MTEEKRCGHCREIKPISEFYIDKNSISGRACWCKSCHKLSKEKNKKSGIYCIENVENGKQYIGKSKNINQRMWDDHQGCIAVEKAIKKYESSIIRFVIEYCDKEDLDYWEMYYIKEWKTKQPMGYNLTDGGKGPEGAKRSKKTSKLIAKNRPDVSGKNNPMYGRRGKNNPNWGSKRTDETKRKIAESRPDINGKNSSWFNIKRKNATSKYHGVSKTIRNKKNIYWAVQISIKGKRTYIGIFKIEIEAAKVYDKYVVEKGLPNKLNFPEDYPNRKEVE
jgi:group I intron endonuclease